MQDIVLISDFVVAETPSSSPLLVVGKEFLTHFQKELLPSWRLRTVSSTFPTSEEVNILKMNRTQGKIYTRVIYAYMTHLSVSMIT